MIKYVYLFLSVSFLSGCSWVNMFKGPDDFYRNHMAEVVKWTYDKSIKEEQNKEPPNGFKSKQYNPDQWQEYWNSVFYTLLSKDFPTEYVGPSPREFYEYIISERRKLQLPEVILDEQTKSLIEQVAGGDRPR